MPRLACGASGRRVRAGGAGSAKSRFMARAAECQEGWQPATHDSQGTASRATDFAGAVDEQRVATIGKRSGRSSQKRVRARVPRTSRLRAIDRVVEKAAAKEVGPFSGRLPHAAGGRRNCPRADFMRLQTDWPASGSCTAVTHGCQRQAGERASLLWPTAHALT
jgi:hypothetical protein